MHDEIIIVAGFGRCGSSLTMQMLNAAGIPGTGLAPAYEFEACSPGRWDAQAIADQKGKAVKVLVPFERFIPGNYKVIWLNRNHKQQAKSQLKFLNAVAGIPTNRTMAANFEKSYAKEKPQVIERLKRLGPLIEINFDDIIRAKWHQAYNEFAIKKIASFLGLSKEQEKMMVGQIIFRDCPCRPDLSIEERLCMNLR